MFLLKGTAFNLKCCPGGACGSSSKENPFFLRLKPETRGKDQNIILLLMSNMCMKERSQTDFAPDYVYVH